MKILFGLYVIYVLIFSFAKFHFLKQKLIFFDGRFTCNVLDKNCKLFTLLVTHAINIHEVLLKKKTY
jgi:hypothetical protein